MPIMLPTCLWISKGHRQVRYTCGPWQCLPCPILFPLHIPHRCVTQEPCLIAHIDQPELGGEPSVGVSADSMWGSLEKEQHWPNPRCLPSSSSNRGTFEVGISMGVGITGLAARGTELIMATPTLPQYRVVAGVEDGDQVGRGVLAPCQSAGVGHPHSPGGSCGS